MTDLFITAVGLSDHDGNPPSRAEIIHCELWLKQFCTMQKRVNKKINSYGLKHIAEVWDSGQPEKCIYVSNGALIQAAANLGYTIARDGWKSPNALFNIRVSDKGKVKKWRC